MVSLAFHLFVVGSYFCFCALMSSCQVKNFFYSFKGKCGATHKATKTVYICKRLSRSIAHITIYNKHKHNHHYSHDTSSSLELSQSMPKLISATGSNWCGRIPVAISNFSGKFIGSFVH